MHVIYTGERVRLRPFEDAQEFLDLDDKLMEVPNEHWGPHWLSRAGREEEYAPAGMLDPGKYSAFAIERRDSGEAVGIEEHGAMERGCVQTWLGTHILREHWHRGFGIEAKLLMLCYLFENYPLELVRADTCGNHFRAQRGLETAGLRSVGRVRGAHFVAGQRWHVLSYSIYREEWARLPIRRLVKRGA
jgi:RimJ/RimL family protein N-acetyltransferase